MATTNSRVHLPMLDDLAHARAAFEANEPRDLFYRAATGLVELSLQGSGPVSVAEAIAILLQTWNKTYYQYRPFKAERFDSIDRLLAMHLAEALPFRERSIEAVSQEEEGIIRGIFHCFEEVLGPVGGAKALHLIAPRFFPLWDRAIAEAYGLALSKAGSNDLRYWAFMLIASRQVALLGGEPAIGRNPLKAIDEYNYCKFSKGWI